MALEYSLNPDLILLATAGTFVLAPLAWRFFGTRRVRFSVRQMLIVTTLVAILLATAAYVHLW